MSWAESVAQLFSALRSAAGQNLAAVGGRHSLAEAMLFLALTLFGLVGTEHRISPFFAAAGQSRRTMILNSGQKPAVVGKQAAHAAPIWYYN